MKKLSTFIIVIIVTLLTSYSAFCATSDFSNDKALNSIFEKLQKEFLKYKKNEVIPLESMGAIITDENQERIPRTSKKISDSQIKAAAEKRLNDIKIAIEIEGERLGGFSQQDYKIISDHLTQKLFFARNSEYGWDFDGKIVKLYFSLSGDKDWVSFKGLKGNFARMGKEKDQVDLADLQVKDKIIRYLNQSIQQGKKVSPEMLNKLPAEVEKLFNECGLSKIVAARTLATIHNDIYTPFVDVDDYTESYDGSKSIEEILEDYKDSIESDKKYREEEKQLDYYEYPDDMPSSVNKEFITKKLVDGEISENFTQGFSKPITLDELANLYFSSKKLDEKIIIEDNIIAADSPDYIKKAFVFGMIDDGNNLEKPMTRLEAARKLVYGTIYDEGFWDTLSITDCAEIPIADQVEVGSCLKGRMKTRVDKFEPNSSYTKEEAIIDKDQFKFGNLRGYNIPFSLSEPSSIIVGKNKINLLFNDKDEIKQYIEDNFKNTVLGKTKLNGNYIKIDTGCALIELFTPENGIKFTIKNGVKFIDLEEGYYGPTLAYKIEPRIIKSNEKVDMNMQIDSFYKKLYSKLDPILAKIIKPKMTQEQKIKAIHDFVVKHITYDIKYRDEQTGESIITTIDKGRGVCGDYCLLFMHLCKRASIPCTYEAGDPDTVNHAWNAVFLNGKWLFVDTTWDDGPNGKILYTYYLKDRFTFMKDHTPFMGTPDKSVYTEIDNMNIKTQDELRAYLLKNFYWVDGFKLTFRMSDKKIKPFIGYMRDSYVKVELKYDSINNLYTIMAKARK